MSNLSKAIKMLKRAKEEAQKELGKQAHKLADSGKTLSDKILAGYYHAINKIDDLIDNIAKDSAPKAKKEHMKVADESAPKRRGRKPAVKVEAQKEAEAPKRRGRKPAAEKAETAELKKNVKAAKPAKKRGRKPSKGSVDSPISVIREHLASVHAQLADGSLARADAISQLVEKGVNRNTAQTQYSLYIKQHGIPGARAQGKAAKE